MVAEGSGGHDKAPVCGCDGLTYWNAATARARGMGIATRAACAKGVVCGGLIGADCPSDAICNYRVDSKDGCNVSDHQGSCWVMPATCADIVVGAKARACGDLVCGDECKLIKAGVTWYEDATCPQ